MKKFTGSDIIGIILILLGVTFTIDNIFYIDIDITDLIFSLPTILFFIGLSSLKQRDRKTKPYLFFGLAGAGWILILAGYSPLDLLIDNWPVLIIIAGALIILSYNKNQRRSEKNLSDLKSGRFEKLDEFIFWRGLKRNFQGIKFAGGDITVLMGGAHLDFRSAELSGEKIVLNATVIMGGIELRIPSDWNIIFTGITLFGGTDDERLRRPGFGIDWKKSVEIKGLVLFGGLGIKS